MAGSNNKDLGACICQRTEKRGRMVFRRKIGKAQFFKKWCSRLGVHNNSEPKAISRRKKISDLKKNNSELIEVVLIDIFSFKR